MHLTAVSLKSPENTSKQPNTYAIKIENGNGNVEYGKFYNDEIECVINAMEECKPLKKIN